MNTPEHTLFAFSAQHYIEHSISFYANRNFFIFLFAPTCAIKDSERFLKPSQRSQLTILSEFKILMPDPIGMFNGKCLDAISSFIFICSSKIFIIIIQKCLKQFQHQLIRYIELKYSRPSITERPTKMKWTISFFFFFFDFVIFWLPFAIHSEKMNSNNFRTRKTFSIVGAGAATAAVTMDFNHFKIIIMLKSSNINEVFFFPNSLRFFRFVIIIIIRLKLKFLKLGMPRYTKSLFEYSKFYDDLIFASLI